MTTIILIIVMLLLGLVLLTLEIVALPGGVAGVLGFLLLAGGIVWSYQAFGNTFGTIALLVSIVAAVAFLVVLLKTKTWKRFSLKEESDSKVNQVDKTAISKGARGITIARLAPTGKAVIEGETVEVHAINHFIDPDRPIEVVAVEGYRIDVREITTDAEDK
jgi:membrane-bound serine protease (ClpP class)